MGSVKEIIGELNKESFVSLLSKLIGEAQFVQNNPKENLIPQEDKIVNHVLDVLNPYSTANGGPLLINHVSYAPGRGNLIVEYPGTVSGKVVSFVGSHMDVVPANPDTWVLFFFHLESHFVILLYSGMKFVFKLI